MGLPRGCRSWQGASREPGDRQGAAGTSWNAAGSTAPTWGQGEQAQGPLSPVPSSSNLCVPSGQARWLRGCPAKTGGTTWAIGRGTLTPREPSEAVHADRPDRVCRACVAPPSPGTSVSWQLRAARLVLRCGGGLCRGTTVSSHHQPLLFQELLLEFESEMQKREHGFRLQADSMSNVVLTHELKVGRGLRAVTIPSTDVRGCS